MAFIREIRRGKRKKSYFYLVESVRVGRKVWQRNIKYMGTTRPTGEQVEQALSDFRERGNQQ